MVADVVGHLDANKQSFLAQRENAHTSPSGGRGGGGGNCASSGVTCLSTCSLAQ